MGMEMIQMQCEMLWERGCLKMGMVVNYRMELIEIEWNGQFAIGEYFDNFLT